MFSQLNLKLKSLHWQGVNFLSNFRIKVGLCAVVPPVWVLLFTPSAHSSNSILRGAMLTTSEDPVWWNQCLLPGQDSWRTPSSRCCVRTWLWRRVAEENLFPHCEQRSANVLLLGGDEGDGVSAAAAAFSATWVWRWALRRDIRLNLRPHSSHSDHTLRLFFCTNTGNGNLCSHTKKDRNIAKFDPVSVVYCMNSLKRCRYKLTFCVLGY